MPNTHSTLTSLFSDIADAIRAKTGETNTIIADNFPTAIAAIPTGGGGPSNVSYFSGYTIYDSTTEEITWSINTGKNSAPMYALIVIRFSTNMYIVQVGSSTAYHPSTDPTWDVGTVTVTQSGTSSKVYSYVISGVFEQYSNVIYDAYFIYS